MKPIDDSAHYHAKHARFEARTGAIDVFVPLSIEDVRHGMSVSLWNPFERRAYADLLREILHEVESDACLFPEERAARDAAFDMQGVPKP